MTLPAVSPPKQILIAAPPALVQAEGPDTRSYAGQESGSEDVLRTVVSFNVLCNLVER